MCKIVSPINNNSATVNTLSKKMEVTANNVANVGQKDFLKKGSSPEGHN
jgi:flagellar basal body rod protein FlgG